MVVYSKGDCSIRRFYRINHYIQAGSVRVIDENGEQLGVLPLSVALSRAREAGMDLVEVAPEAQPPVCRIIEFSRFRYEQNKKEQEAKKKLKEVEIKEVRMGPFTGDHDFKVRIRRIEEFLADKNKVKVVIDFPRRALSHPEFGHQLLDRIKETLKDKIVIEREPKLEGRRLFMSIAPASGSVKKEQHDAKAKNT